MDDVWLGGGGGDDEELGWGDEDGGCGGGGSGGYGSGVVRPMEGYDYVYGITPVLNALAAGRREMAELFVQEVGWGALNGWACLLRCVLRAHLDSLSPHPILIKSPPPPPRA